MKVASQIGRRGAQAPRELVSPLEQTLDAAVESERHRWVRAARERAELMRATARPARVELALANGADAGPLSERRPALLPVRVPAHYSRADAKRLGRHRASEVNGWAQVCAVTFGLFAMLAALKLPLSATLPAPARALGALSAQVSSAPERAAEVHAPSAAVTTGEPQRVPAEPVPRASMLPPLESPDSKVARPKLDPGALRSAVAAVAAPESPAPPEPPRPSAAPIAQREQEGTANVSPVKRAGVVTVDDLFGIGGDEPLPPEALEEPAPAAPPPARKPARAAPAARTTLFYHEPPF